MSRTKLGMIGLGLGLGLGCSDLRHDLPGVDDAKAGHAASAEPGESAGRGGGGGAKSAAGSGGKSEPAQASGGAGAGGKPAAGSGGHSGSGGKSAAGSGGQGAAGPAMLAYAPHNVPEDANLDAPGDLILNTAGCGNNPLFDTSTGMLKGCNGKDDTLKFNYQEILQPDTSLGTLPAALIVTRRFVLEQGMRLTVEGNRPLIIVALDEALISGQLEASAKIGMARGGGFGPTDVGQNGLGPGGGGKPMGLSGGSGGAYCGKGGDGGPPAGGMSSLGGKPYGKPENVPLIGGSSGSCQSAYASAGGGAIQISAGKRIEVSGVGVVHVGGGGANWSSNGGGAGGAILLEAPSVRVLGHLAANGGSGSSYGSADATNGQDGSTDDQPAVGGKVGDTAAGNGSAGADIDGKPGAAGPADTTWTGGGGGGGAGRIRINVGGSATPDLSGALISPSQSTSCFSIGSLD